MAQLRKVAGCKLAFTIRNFFALIESLHRISVSCVSGREMSNVIVINTSDNLLAYNGFIVVSMWHFKARTRVPRFGSEFDRSRNSLWAIYVWIRDLRSGLVVLSKLPANVRQSLRLAPAFVLAFSKRNEIYTITHHDMILALMSLAFWVSNISAMDLVSYELLLGISIYLIYL